jgi:hypothetical protein
MGEEMADDRNEAVRALLSQAEEAHGVFESTELKGVHDENWPHWYAAYVVEHGLGDLVGHELTADRLAQFLAPSFDEFKSAEPKPTEPWATYTARRIVAEL